MGIAVIVTADSSLNGSRSKQIKISVPSDQEVNILSLLVLADEPTGQLDKENARNIASLFSEINLRMRTTIVMVTHSDETSSFAHRILKLNGGILE